MHDDKESSGWTDLENTVDFAVGRFRRLMNWAIEQQSEPRYVVPSQMWWIAKSTRELAEYIEAHVPKPEPEEE